MLPSRAELTFDFGGARFDPIADRDVLGWLLNQFLYGEVAANQIGEWLYEAPDLESARFLARQAVEELQHVDTFVRILGLLGLSPAPAHPGVHLLVTGLRARSWPEHVALVMAAGEGMVLMALYGLIDTIGDPRAVDLLERAVRQEARHVEFGEAWTMRLLRERPSLRRRLLGLNLLSLWAVERLATAMRTRVPQTSPVMRRLPEFARAVAASHELRLRRLGLLDRPLADLPAWRRALLIAWAQLGKGGARLAALVAAPLRAIGLGRRRRLTDTYLADPALRVDPAPRDDASRADSVI